MFWAAEEVYDEVMKRLDLPDDDIVYAAFIRGILQKRTVDYIVGVIWANFDEKKAKHFRQYLNEMSVIEPDLSHTNTLIEFAMQYPDLKEKIFAGLPEFFDKFIEKFNELS